MSDGLGDCTRCGHEYEAHRVVRDSMKCRVEGCGCASYRWKLDSPPAVVATLTERAEGKTMDYKYRGNNISHETAVRNHAEELSRMPPESIAPTTWTLTGPGRQVQTHTLTDILDWVLDELNKTDPVHTMPADSAERLTQALESVMQGRRDMLVGRMLRDIANGTRVLPERFRNVMDKKSVRALHTLIRATLLGEGDH